LKREAGGAVQQHVYLFNFKQLPLLKPAIPVQTYIGEKIRQAQHFQQCALDLQQEVDQLVTVELIQEALRCPRTRSNRVAIATLEPRLDAKFYSRHLIEVERAARICSRVTIRGLNPRVNNGFEHRRFVKTGRAYVTVSQVASKRLDLS